MRKKFTAVCLAAGTALGGCGETQQSANAQNTATAAEDVFYIQVNDNVMTASFADNSSADAFRELLSQGPLTVEMEDYANFEKVGDLGTSLPTNDTNITTTYGDVILYLGSKITIYYNTNTWSFTRLGHINDLSQDELKEILGTGGITATFYTE